MKLVKRFFFVIILILLIRVVTGEFSAVEAQEACYTGSRCTYNRFYEWVTTNPSIECGAGSARIVWSECGLDTCNRTFTYTWDGIVSIEGARQRWSGTHYGDWCFESTCQSESFTWDQYKSAAFQIEFRVDSTCCMQSISDIPITTCSARPTPTPVPYSGTCNTPCQTNENCDYTQGLDCRWTIDGSYKCRNWTCSSEEDCICPEEPTSPPGAPTSTPTPIPTPTSGPTPTSARPTPTPLLNTCPAGTVFSSCIWSFNSCPAGETKVNNCSFCSVAGTSCCCAPEPTVGPCTYQCIFAPSGCQFLSPACTLRSGTCSGAGMSCCECPSGPTATPGGPTPTTPPPSGRWFQTYVGDAHSQGSLDANVPAGEFFSCKGGNTSSCDRIDDIGDSGLLTYDGLRDVGSGSESGPLPAPRWTVEVDDGFSWEDNKYGYEYYNNRLTKNVTLSQNSINQSDIESAPGGIKVTLVNPPSGRLSLGSSINIAGNKKSIVLVNGTLVINQKVSVNKNQTNFLAFIVSGNVEIDGARQGSFNNPDVEGVYVAEGQIRTGTGGNQLYAGGIFVGWGGFSLQRTYSTGNNPAEVFIYRPDLLVNMPKEMKEEKVSWREVAP